MARLSSPVPVVLVVAAMLAAPIALSAGVKVRSEYDKSFDFRGLGETRMNYRPKSSDDPDLVQGTFDQAYISPLSSVFADYVYNSLLTGRPYFLQMMDDIKIAELFIRSKNVDTHPLTIAATGDAYAVATRFKEIDPSVKILETQPESRFDWSSIVARGQEQWPIFFLMPYGAEIHSPGN